MATSPKISNSIIILCLLFLASFLFHWNYKQYQKELGLLQKNLDMQFELAAGEIRDSMLNSFIQGVLKNKENYVNTFEQKDSRRSHQIFSRDTIISFVENFSDSSDRFNTYSFAIPHVNIQKDGSDIMESFRDTCNSVHFKFNERLENEGLIDEFQIHIMSSEKPIDGNVEFSLNQRSFGTKKKDDIVISEYRGYLFKKIWPSSLMSLLLFLLVTAGFYFLNKSRKEQEQINLLKNEFVSNMTHELKTPISTISVALEALTNFDQINDPAKTKEYLDISKHELNRLHILLDKVLKMSSFEDSGMKLEKQTVDIKVLISEILKSMKLHFEKNKVYLDYTVTGVNHLVYGDKVHLTNVLYNLIDNAVKYSQDDSKIHINIGENQNHIQVAIKDNGIGIPEKYKTQIFDRFFRVPQNDLHNTKGHGLGLNYVKEVIDKHDGHIEVDSKENQGTTMTLIFNKQTLA